MKNNKKILLGVGILIVFIGIGLFIFKQSQNDRCSWKVTEEEKKKYAALSSIWSMISGFEFDKEKGCVPVGGSEYVENVVPFKTKKECESACNASLIK